MSTSLVENLPLGSPEECKDISCKISTKPRRSWKQFIHRRNGKRVYVCNADSCGKAFNYLSSLVKHERIHRGERPYTCKVCHQSFVQSSNLKRHERTHTGEKTFECTQCQKKFSTASNLRQHLQIHNDEIRRKHYNCDQCGRSYLYPSSLNKHSKFCDGTKETDTASQTGSESRIEPTLRKQVKLEEKTEDILTESEQKSQPGSPFVNINAMPLPQFPPSMFSQKNPLMITPPFVNTYPGAESRAFFHPIQSAGPILSSEDQLLNKLMLQRACFNTVPTLYQQQQPNIGCVKQLINPNVNAMGINNFPALLHQRQKIQSILLQQASLAFELGRMPMY